LLLAAVLLYFSRRGIEWKVVARTIRVNPAGLCYVGDCHWDFANVCAVSTLADLALPHDALHARHALQHSTRSVISSGRHANPGQWLRVAPGSTKATASATLSD